MIEKLSLALAKYFANKDVYSHNKINVYKYGFELLLSTVINLSCILLISIIMGVTIEAIFFCVAFIPLRLAAGGYHAKHHWSCVLEFNMIFLGFAVLQRFISIDFSMHFSFCAVIISSISIWSFAPVEALNKPLKPEQRKRQRNRSLLIACSNIAISLLFYTTDILGEYLKILAFYMSGALAASLSLTVAIITNKKFS